MKKSIFLSGLLFLGIAAFAQSREGTVAYQRTDQPAAVIELPYPPSVVNAAMNDYLSRKGKSKGTDIKGFTTYRNTAPLIGDSSNADLYFKTERKSRKEKETTVVSLLVLPSDANPNSSMRNLTMDEARDYLDGLSSVVQTFDLEQTIKDQNDAVLKAEAKLKSLVNTAEDLEKKQTDIARKILNNKDEQAEQVREIEAQKQKLATYVSQRKF